MCALLNALGKDSWLELCHTTLHRRGIWCPCGWLSAGGGGGARVCVMTGSLQLLDHTTASLGKTWQWKSVVTILKERASHLLSVFTCVWLRVRYQCLLPPDFAKWKQEMFPDSTSPRSLPHPIPPSTHLWCLCSQHRIVPANIGQSSMSAQWLSG